MKITPRERLTSLLDRETGSPGFSATAEAEPALLGLEVAGVGPVKFPVTPAQARKLRALGAPARYGQGTRTLTDASVRDTWELPKDSVTIRWDPGFGPILDALRAELGLPSRCTLRAEFHSMLVYEKGQFFRPHQDSEKDDAMVGSLVVTLPSRYTGGDLVVEQNGTAVQCRGSATALAFAAFYADCRHEVRPVKTGYRITLTFNLLVEGGTLASSPPDASVVADLTSLLREHFTTPIAVPYSGVPNVPPNRLVYLLAHEYTERSLSWDRLKGADAAGAGLLRAAADQENCRVMLALTEVRETWDAYSSDDDEWEESWDDEDEDGEDEDEDEGEGEGDGEGEYELNSMIERSTRLVSWTDPVTGRREAITLDVDDTELCDGASSSNAGREPFEQEYEGYMGNYGNTLDRWYRRAGLVLFPADREFANRAEASPGWAIARIGEQARAGDLVGARAAAADLAPFWTTASGENLTADSLDNALTTSYAVDDAATATLLLAPFQAENLTASIAQALADVAGRYGESWTGGLLLGWFGDGRHHNHGGGGDRLAWYSSLPGLCKALHAAGGSAEATARDLTDLSWRRLVSEAHRLPVGTAPSVRAAWSAELGRPLAAVLTAAEFCHASSVSGEIVRYLAALGDEATAWILPALRAASSVPGGGAPGGAASDGSGLGFGAVGSFESIAVDCGRRLRDRLARPARAADDWSIAAPTGCPCELCEVLAGFLRNRDRRVLEWPLAEQKRKHVHSRLDRFELPVGHETRREGRPFTLVLTKRQALFDRERAARKQDAADVRWLSAAWPSISE